MRIPARGSPHLEGTLRVLTLFLLMQASAWAHGQPTDRALGLPLPKPGAYLRFGVEHNFVLPKGITLPQSVDLSPIFSLPGDQGPYYSCTAWAIGYGLMTYFQNLEQGLMPDRSLPLDTGTVFSPRYLFKMAKQHAQPDSSTDACMHGVDMEATLTVACSLGDHPTTWYENDSSARWCTDSVSANTLWAGLRHKLPMPVALITDCPKCIGATQVPFNPVQWKYHLKKKKPLLVGLYIDCSFSQGGDSAYAAGKPFTWDKVQTDDTDDCPGGGHALLCCGYDDRDSTFLFYNSFGTHWGTNGLCRMTYRALRANCLQAYVCTDVINDSIPPPPPRSRRLTHNSDTTMWGGMNVGEYDVLQGMGVLLANYDSKRKTSLIELIDPNTSAVLHSLVVPDLIPREVLCKDRMWSVSSLGGSWIRRFLGDDVRIRVVCDPDGDDKLQRGSGQYQDFLQRR
jgi:hypothetical protein